MYKDWGWSWGVVGKVRHRPFWQPLYQDFGDAARQYIDMILHVYCIYIHILEHLGRHTHQWVWLGHARKKRAADSEWGLGKVDVKADDGMCTSKSHPTFLEDVTENHGCPKMNLKNQRICSENPTVSLLLFSEKNGYLHNIAILFLGNLFPEPGFRYWGDGLWRGNFYEALSPERNEKKSWNHVKSMEIESLNSEQIVPCWCWVVFSGILWNWKIRCEFLK